MTAHDIATFLRAHAPKDDGWKFWDYEAEADEPVPGLGVVTVVENVGGEDQGSHAHLVFRVLPEDGPVRYFRVNGYYSSYDGTEWDGDLYEVFPRIKSITVYE